jgi:hypothetical protein
MTRSPRRPWLYDPAVGGLLVRAHRAPGGGAAGDVASDVLWSEVLGVLRWAEATLGCPAELAEGSAWRTAAAAAGLLRRLPGLCAEAGLPWPGAQADPDEAGLPGRERLAAAADRLAGLLCARPADPGCPSWSPGWPPTSTRSALLPSRCSPTGRTGRRRPDPSGSWRAHRVRTRP